MDRYTLREMYGSGKDDSEESGSRKISRIERKIKEMLEGANQSWFRKPADGCSRYDCHFV
jgi:hypothetical protein